jgi:hypothetical protein
MTTDPRTPETLEAILNGRPQKITQTGGTIMSKPKSALRKRPTKAELNDCWVVIISDPESTDWTPWPVIAPTIEEAVTSAVSDWKRWAGPGWTDLPYVIKVYPNSWTSPISWSAEGGQPLGSFDMSGLENSRFPDEWPPKPIIIDRYRP